MDKIDLEILRAWTNIPADKKPAVIAAVRRFLAGETEEAASALRAIAGSPPAKPDPLP